jgi:ion channel
MMPPQTTQLERNIIFLTDVLDVLCLTHVLRSIAGRALDAPFKAWWRLLLLCGTFAIGSVSLILRHRKFIRGGPNRPVLRALWWVESLIRVTVLSLILAYKERFNASPQNLFALWEALVLSLAISISRVWIVSRGFTMVELSREQRTVLGAQALVFLPLFLSAVIFHFTDGFPFDTSWNFVSHTALTVGFGNIRVRSIPGKVVLVTLGNVTLAFVAFLLLAMRDVLPAAHTRRDLLCLAATLVAFWMLGSLAFSLIEGWDYLDGVYFTWASLTTVGFGDFHPVTTAGSEFWLSYTYVGACLFAVVLATASHAIHERNVANSFEMD